MVTRALSGIVFVIIVLGSLYWGFLPSTILFTIIAYLGAREFYKLANKFSSPFGYLGGIFASSIVLFTGWSLQFPNSAWIYSIWILPIIGFVISLLRSKSETAIVDISITIAGALYVSLPFVSLLFLSISPTWDVSAYSYVIPMSIFGLTWTNDVGAYLVGKNFGKNKLFERISPKKTWEGSIGGLILTAIVAGVISHYTVTDWNLIMWIGGGVLVSIFANVGDLMESTFKRNAGVKDSGNIMPGHGGVLDRFDAIFMTAPVVLAYLVFLSRY